MRNATVTTTAGETIRIRPEALWSGVIGNELRCVWAIVGSRTDVFVCITPMRPGGAAHITSMRMPLADALPQ